MKTQERLKTSRFDKVFFLDIGVLEIDRWKLD